MSFAGQVAIVTGGASGIGMATVERLRAEGAQVVAADIADAPDTAHCDVTDEAAVDALVESTLQRHGRLDLAVNAAGGVVDPRLLTELPTEEWHRIIALNLTGVFYCLRAELRAMRAARSGSVVCISSGVGLGGGPTMSHYSAAKHGVLGLTKSAALEVADDGVRVNAVCPGAIRTPSLRRWARSDGGLEAMAGGNPMSRLGDASEVANAIVWLLSSEASYMTGAALEVDGGGAARR